MVCISYEGDWATCIYVIRCKIQRFAWFQNTREETGIRNDEEDSAIFWVVILLGLVRCMENRIPYVGIESFHNIHQCSYLDMI